MERRSDEVHINKDEARSGTTPHIVRYVLVISTALAILALSAIWITGALSTSDEPPAEDNEPIMQSESLTP